MHLGDGRWWDDEAGTWRNGQGRAILSPPNVLPSMENGTALTTKVVLAAAHLDHDPGNNRLRNLKALCQRCHMLHDREEHQRRRWLTFRMRKALGDLFILGTQLTAAPLPQSISVNPFEAVGRHHAPLILRSACLLQSHAWSLAVLCQKNDTGRLEATLQHIQRSPLKFGFTTFKIPDRRVAYPGRIGKVLL